MKALSSIRRITILGALISISAAGLFGPALHELAHLDPFAWLDSGPSPEASASALSASTCSCAFHAKERELHASGGKADTTSSSETGQITQVHDCALCRFLAISKLAESLSNHQPTIARTCQRVVPAPCPGAICPTLSTTLPRGPPALVIA